MQVAVTADIGDKEQKVKGLQLITLLGWPRLLPPVPSGPWYQPLSCVHTHLAHKVLHLWGCVVAPKADIAFVPLPEVHNILLPAIHHAVELLYAAAAVLHACCAELCYLFAQLLHCLFVLWLCNQRLGAADLSSIKNGCVSWV